MASIDEILTVAENPEHRRTATVRILLQQSLVARHAELEARLIDALNGDERELRDPVAPDIAREIADLEAELDAARVPFTVRAVSRKQWADLMAANPPTQQQREKSPGIDHNPETFPIAAIAASSVEPVMSVADVRRLEDALNHTQFQLLWQATLDVNVGGVGLPKSRTAGLILHRSGGSVATAAHEGSLAASSSDE